MLCPACFVKPPMLAVWLDKAYIVINFVIKKQGRHRMRRAIIYSCLVGQLVIFCLASNILEALTMFLLFGIVPWQSTPLSPHVMLTFYYLATGTIITLAFASKSPTIRESTGYSFSGAGIIASAQSCNSSSKNRFLSSAESANRCKDFK